MLQLFCWIGCSAVHVTVFQFRLWLVAETFRLRFPVPLLLLLSAGKDSWAAGVPPTHAQRYCRSTVLTACTEHTGLPEGISAHRQKTNILTNIISININTTSNLSFLSTKLQTNLANCSLQS